MSEQRGLLNDASPLPAYSATPSFATRHRPGYQRVASVSFNDTPDTRDITDPTDEIEPAPSGAGHNHGLGISSGSAATPATPSRPAQSSLQRDSTSNLKSTPEHGTPVYSPPSTGALTGSTRFDETFDTSYDANRMYRASRTSLNSANNPPSLYAKSDAGLLSVRSRYEDFAPHQHCASKKTVKTRRCGNWVSITVFVLAVFSTIFSAIFLIIALRGPRYGRFIRKGGSLTPSSAAFLTSLFAKLIELSFVTVVVAFIGQALARRAFKLERARGVTLAELSMRTWILQPGVMITQWESVRYAGVSILGLISFLAALMAILYTSAATALVQPQLVVPDFKNRLLGGLVKTQYANPFYIGDSCRTPIRDVYDPEYKDTTCLQIEHSSMAYQNYRSFLSNWADVVLNYGNGSVWYEQRPPGYAVFNDNTTLTAPWIDITNVTQESFPGYYINNVTMAMPHIGVIQAAIDPLNDIMQPYEVEGATYSIQASVPSPMVNVQCVTLNQTQVSHFVYSEWEGRNKSACNETSWAGPVSWPYCASYPEGTDLWLNGTNFTADPLLYDIFRWGEKWAPYRYPPIFPKLPSDFNSLINRTQGMAAQWGPTAIYFLGKGGPTDSIGASMVSDGEGLNYGLCELQVGLTADCYTTYEASSSGGRMEAVCNSNDKLQFNNSVPAALKGNDTLSKDWVNIGSEWANSLSLNAGLFDANASNARLLGQLILTSGNLSAALPSTAEALAVMAGNTLIQSAMDAPFVMFWNYTNPTIDGQHQYFNASVRVQQYASGGNQPYQKPFYIVLVAVVLMNILILGYFALHRDWYTDFSEPVNLFSLAVNSPPSEALAGSCGCGPSGEQYKVSWKLHKDGEHFYMEGQEKAPEETVNVESPRMSRRRFTQTFEMVGSPVNALKRFSHHL
ncbi:hypothetical protein HII31_09879 [Pseudocercospora fuligena]|uniref:Uncharacterized protein n=1 Tax=Pseudocercospora fuligena TaxID=685502 RepID=A0A8H6RAF4_9PEZI|nr:hypothetical protein HII31_09879 [Pseudocercospora fuligena]